MNQIDTCITCFLPVYNEGRNLPLWWARNGDELRSVRAKLLVIDNGSTDNTLQLVNEFRYQNTTIITNNRNLGIEESISKAKSIITTKYQFILPADDWLASGYLIRAVEVMENISDVGVVYGKSYMVHGSISNQRVHPSRPIGPRSESPVFPLLFNNAIPDISVFRSKFINSLPASMIWPSDGGVTELLAQSRVFYTGQPQCYSGKSTQQLSKQWDTQGKYYHVFKRFVEAAGKLSPERFFICSNKEYIPTADENVLSLTRDLLIKVIDLNYHTSDSFIKIFTAFQYGHPNLRSAFILARELLARNLLYFLLDDLVIQHSGEIKKVGRFGSYNDIKSFSEFGNVSRDEIDHYLRVQLGLSV